MKSSYQTPLEYGAVIDAVVFMQRSKRATKDADNLHVIEFGILDGYSLERFAKHDSEVYAYDIFDEFQGNHAQKDTLEKKFSSYPNVHIMYGDFYEMHEQFEDESIDILHVDIANNGDVAEFMFKYYMRKLKPEGVVLFEGGSEERDQVEWMRRYNKPPIFPVFKQREASGSCRTITLGEVPSVTLVQPAIT